MSNYLVQLVGGSFQDTLQVPVAYGTMVLELTQEGQAPGFLYEDLSPFTTSEVCTGMTFTIPLDAQGNVETGSPAYFVFANNALQPANSFYQVTVYDSRGQRVWGPNSQVVLVSLSPYVGTFDCGQWIPNQISQS